MRSWSLPSSREPFSNFFLRGVPPNATRTAMKSFENPAAGRAGEARSARRPPSIYFFLVDGTGGGEVIAETRTRIKRLKVCTEGVNETRANAFQIRHVCGKSAGAVEQRGRGGAAAFTICAALNVFQIAGPCIRVRPYIEIGTRNYRKRKLPVNNILKYELGKCR